ncbi:MAG TPA: hypothetical protein VE242_14810 [Chthoniobacterales bacterium]|nr:hypothetical protein [Chthoniobacterales bacterium]
MKIISSRTSVAINFHVGDFPEGLDAMTTIVECPREKKDPTRYWAFAGLHQFPGHIVDGGDVISVNCIAKTESISKKNGS